jgi:RNA polymerase sigma-32 factor
MKISYTIALQAPMLSIDQERDAISRWQESKDSEALETLVFSHARQVFASAMRLSLEPTEVEDLFAEGVVGLIHAAERFDLSRDVRFSTYAHWWILNYTSKAFSRLRAVVDVPDRSRRAQSEVGFSVLGDIPSIPLDATPQEGGFSSKEQMQSPDPNPEELVIRSSKERWMHRIVNESLQKLDELEREVVVSRNLKEDPVSFDVLAQMLGFTREHLRKVERRALSRLKFDLVGKGVNIAGLG